MKGQTAQTSQTAHLRKVLRTAITSLGLSLKEVQQRMGVSGGYLTRLFAGEIDVKVDHVVAIAEVLGVEPEELFWLAFPPPQGEPSPTALRLRAAFGVTAPPSQQHPASGLQREIEQIVQQALGKMLAKLAQ
jgi:transcriptional regulator with XRE-family HTH domain